MGNYYQKFQAEERAMIMLMRQQNSSVREIARVLSRVPGCIGREVNRNLLDSSSGYDPVCADARAKGMTQVGRRRRNLAPDTPLFGVVYHFPRQRWSPEQIGGAYASHVLVKLSKVPRMKPFTRPGTPCHVASRGAI